MVELLADALDAPLLGGSCDHNAEDVSVQVSIALATERRVLHQGLDGQGVGLLSRHRGGSLLEKALEQGFRSCIEGLTTEVYHQRLSHCHHPSPSPA
jgi:hypothetical protein